MTTATRNRAPVDDAITLAELHRAPYQIYKRLRAFEAVFRGEELDEIDRKYLERQAAGLTPRPADPAPGEGGPDRTQSFEE